MVPDCGSAVLSNAFSIEAIRLGDATRLVVTTDEVDSSRISKFQADEECDGLNAEQTAVDVVAYIGSAYFVAC